MKFLPGRYPAFAAALLLVLPSPAFGQPGSVDTMQRLFSGSGGGGVDFRKKREALRQAAAGNAQALIALTAVSGNPTVDDYDSLVQHATALLLAGRREAALKAARQAERLFGEAWKDAYYPPKADVLVDVFIHAGSSAEGVKLLRNLLARFDTDNAPQAKLAGLLATLPEVRLRNGQEALALAIKACRISNFRDLRCASAYAAAAAECGQFEEAVRRQTIIAGKGRDGRDWTAEEMSEARERLAAYQARQPWRLRPGPQAMLRYVRLWAGDL